MFDAITIWQTWAQISWELQFHAPILVIVIVEAMAAEVWWKRTAGWHKWSYYTGAWRRSSSPTAETLDTVPLLCRHAKSPSDHLWYWKEKKKKSHGAQNAGHPGCKAPDDLRWSGPMRWIRGAARNALHRRLCKSTVWSDVLNKRHNSAAPRGKTVFSPEAAAYFASCSCHISEQSDEYHVVQNKEFMNSEVSGHTPSSNRRL